MQVLEKSYCCVVINGKIHNDMAIFLIRITVVEREKRWSLVISFDWFTGFSFDKKYSSLKEF